MAKPVEATFVIYSFGMFSDRGGRSERFLLEKEAELVLFLPQQVTDAKDDPLVPSLVPPRVPSLFPQLGSGADDDLCSLGLVSIRVPLSKEISSIVKMVRLAW